MYKSKISFSVFDRMIHENPTKWMTLENDDEEMLFFLKYLNQWIQKNDIERLMIYDLPEEFHYMFSNCKKSTLEELKEEIILNLN